MAISKVIYKSSPNATPETWIDATPATAAAADIIAPKTAMLADGVLTTGTGSGGGGASNVFTGSFTATSTVGTADTFAIPYTGTGYIVALMIWIDGGYTGNTDWNSLLQIRTIGQWSAVKSATDTTPNYLQDFSQSQMTITFLYKSSASNAASYGNYSSSGSRAYWNQDASYANSAVVRIRNATTVSYYTRDPSATNSSRYGFWAGAKYNYVAVYSS